VKRPCEKNSVGGHAILPKKMVKSANLFTLKLSNADIAKLKKAL